MSLGDHVWHEVHVSLTLPVGERRYRLGATVSPGLAQEWARVAREMLQPLAVGGSAITDAVLARVADESQAVALRNLAGPVRARPAVRRNPKPR